MTQDSFAERPRSTALTLKLCRLVIFALMALLAAATLYVVALGGIASAGGQSHIIQTEISDAGGPGDMLALSLPGPADALPADAQVKRTILCTDTDGKSICKDSVAPAGKADARPADGKSARTAAPAATKGKEERVRIECKIENGKRACTRNGVAISDPAKRDWLIAGVGQAGAGRSHAPGMKTEKTIVVTQHADFRRQIDIDGGASGPGGTTSPWHKAVGGVLAGLSLALLLVALFQLERLLAVMERASLFSQAAVRRLQWVGAALLATAILPHFEWPAVIDSATTALVSGGTPWPAPVQFSLEFNLVLLVASLFLILMARVVEEGVWLHDEMRGTV